MDIISKKIIGGFMLSPILIFFIWALITEPNVKWILLMLVGVAMAITFFTVGVCLLTQGVCLC